MKSLIALIVLACNVAYAAPLNIPLRTDLKPVALKYENRSGVWFVNEDAEYLLKLRMDTVPQLITVVNKYDALTTDLNLQLIDAKIIIDAKTKQIDQYKILTDSQSAQLQKCLETREKWYNSRTLWFTAGLVAGAAGTGYLVSLVH